MSEMTDKEFQAAAKEAARVTHLRAAEKLAMQLELTEDIEIVTKVYNATKDTSGAVQEKKTDPYAGLPVFNITFTNGGAQVTAQALPAAVEVVEEVQPPRQLESPAPPAEEKKVEESLDDLLASINLDVLG